MFDLWFKVWVFRAFRFIHDLGFRRYRTGGLVCMSYELFSGSWCVGKRILICFSGVSGLGISTLASKRNGV